MGIVNKVVLGFFWALTCMAFSSYVLGKILVGAWLPWYTNLLNQVFISNFLITLIVLTVIMVILAYLCYRSAHQNPVIKIFLLTLFALVTGAFVSPMVAIALALDVDIAVAFAITGGIFFFPAIIGWITDKDLTEWRNWILGLLIFAIVISVINLFYPTTSFTLLVSIVVVIIFVPLVMYDVNRIRNKLEEEEWIVGVVDLFLDFLNIFVRILYILILIASKKKS
jgi:FtsH-binding integral membrane protein